MFKLIIFDLGGTILSDDVLWDSMANGLKNTLKLHIRPYLREFIRNLEKMDIKVALWSSEITGWTRAVVNECLKEINWMFIWTQEFRKDLDYVLDTFPRTYHKHDILLLDDNEDVCKHNNKKHYICVNISPYSTKNKNTDRVFKDINNVILSGHKIYE